MDETIILYSNNDYADYVEIPLWFLDQYEETAREPSLIAVLLEDVNQGEGQIEIPLNLNHLSDIGSYFEQGGWTNQSQIALIDTNQRTQKDRLREVSAYLNVPYYLLPSLVSKPKNKPLPIAKTEDEEEEYYSEDSEVEDLRRELEEARLAGEINYSSSEEEEVDPDLYV